MIGQKPYTYAVLAIALGYILISVVPSRLNPNHYLALETERPGENVTVEGGTLLEDEASITTEQEALGETASAAKTAADEARTAASGLTTVGGFFGVFGNLLISLAVAFGVYWIAKQRFA